MADVWVINSEAEGGIFTCVVTSRGRNPKIVVSGLEHFDFWNKLTFIIY